MSLYSKMLFNNLQNITDRAKKVFLTSSATLTAYSMEVGDLIVHVTTDDANAITVTLPSVSEAAGLTYVIRLVTDGGVSCVVQDLGGDASFSDFTMEDAGDYLVLYSDGTYWYTLVSQD